MPPEKQANLRKAGLITEILAYFFTPQQAVKVLKFEATK
jgi:hypothetical protein